MRLRTRAVIPRVGVLLALLSPVPAFGTESHGAAAGASSDAASLARGAGDRTEGIQWLDIGVDEAMSRSRKTGKPVVLDFWASWCGPCKKMEQELWSQPAGAELGRKSIPIHFDFDGPEGQKLKRRFNVMGLPCVIVIDPRGNEVDRLLGFDSREGFLEKLQPLLDGVDPIPELERKLAANPESAATLLELARRRLFRGDEARAYQDFLRLATLDPPPVMAAEVDFLLGRYLQRVREAPGEALPHWKHITAAYPDSPYMAGAIYWGLDAYAALGQTDKGIAWAHEVSTRHPDNGDIHYTIASWAKERGVQSQEALAHARRARELGVEADDLEEVIAALSATRAGTK